MAEINGKAVDLSGVVPLKVADWRKLEGHGITLEGLGAGNVEQLARFAIYVAGKADGTVTREDVDAMTLPALSAFISEALAGSGAEAIIADPG